MSRSSSEAEYRAIVAATCELQWLSFLLHGLGLQPASPPILFSDSKSAIAIAENPVFFERTKHIELDCHLVREKLQKGVIKLLQFPTGQQLAGVFTKPHPLVPFSLSLPSWASTMCMLQLAGAYQRRTKPLLKKMHNKAVECNLVYL